MSQQYKPTHGGYPTAYERLRAHVAVDVAADKDRVSDFRSIADVAYGPERQGFTTVREAAIAGAAYERGHDTVPVKDTGDVRPTSIGDIYPLCVVGIANGDRLHFEVHNLKTDEVMCGAYSDLYGKEFVRGWRKALSAYEAISNPSSLSIPTVWRKRGTLSHC